MVLSGMLYLRLEDYFDTSSSTHCLPLEPQGILLAEVRGGEHTQGGRGEREGAGGRRERGEREGREREGGERGEREGIEQGITRRKRGEG